MPQIRLSLTVLALGFSAICQTPAALAQTADDSTLAELASSKKPKDAQGKRMVAAFQGWAKKWGVKNAAFSAMRDGKVVGEAGLGDEKPSGAEPVASLSKAITGVCTMKLVETKKLNYSSRLGQLIPDYFTAHPPADPAARNITVAQLLTQTSGIGYDPTQGSAEFAALDRTKPDPEGVVALALARTLSGKVYFYNNVNYETLGLVIATVTKKPYDKYCSDAVLKPAGAKGVKLNPDWRIMNAFGGWKISAQDYAKFLDHFRPGSKLLKTKPSAWPKVALGNGAYYSVGTLLRQNADGTYNFWHTGAWTWSSPPADFGSHYAVFLSNLRYAVTWGPKPSDDAQAELDNVIYAAAFQTGQSAPAVARAPQAASTPGSDRGQVDAAIAGAAIGR